MSHFRYIAWNSTSWFMYTCKVRTCTYIRTYIQKCSNIPLKPTYRRTYVCTYVNTWIHRCYTLYTHIDTATLILASICSLQLHLSFLALEMTDVFPLCCLWTLCFYPPVVPLGSKEHQDVLCKMLTVTVITVCRLCIVVRICTYERTYILCTYVCMYTCVHIIQ